MIIVTGAAGFIGSNLARALNRRGRSDLILVDDLTQGQKFSNMVDIEAADYIDYKDFLAMVLNQRGFPFDVDVIFHQGANSTTTDWDGRAMLADNYEYSKVLLHAASEHKIPFIYASSAAIYGCETDCRVNVKAERPLNVYGYSKLLFDRYYLSQKDKLANQVVGLRYFNVYGMGEGHKLKMCSVVRHFYNELMADNTITVFSCDGIEPGEQKRDFIYVDDAVSMNLWCWDNPQLNGIYNCGTGVAVSFNDIANALIEWHGQGEIIYKPMPEHMRGRYQTYTQADMSEVLAHGYAQPFTDLKAGVTAYANALKEKAL